MQMQLHICRRMSLSQEHGMIILYGFPHLNAEYNNVTFIIENEENGRAPSFDKRFLTFSID